MLEAQGLGRRLAVDHLGEAPGRDPRSVPLRTAPCELLHSKSTAPAQVMARLSQSRPGFNITRGCRDGLRERRQSCSFASGKCMRYARRAAPLLWRGPPSRKSFCRRSRTPRRRWCRGRRARGPCKPRARDPTALMCPPHGWCTPTCPCPCRCGLIMKSTLALARGPCTAMLSGARTRLPFVLKTESTTPGESRPQEERTCRASCLRSPPRRRCSSSCW